MKGRGLRFVALKAGLLGIGLLASGLALPDSLAAQSVTDWMAQGRSAAAAGRNEDARAAFAKALVHEPENIEALMGRALATSQITARLKQADDDFSQVIALAPDHWPAYLHRGALRYRLGFNARFNSQLNTGKRWLRQAQDDLTRFLDAQHERKGSEVAYALENRARSHFILDEYAEALRDFAAAAQADPPNATAYHMERARLLTIQGKTAEGQAMYAQVAETLRDDSRDADSARAQDRITQRGEAFWQLGREDDACRDFRWLCAEAKSGDPTSLECRRARERCP